MFSLVPPAVLDAFLACNAAACVEVHEVVVPLKGFVVAGHLKHRRDGVAYRIAHSGSEHCYLGAGSRHVRHRGHVVSNCVHNDGTVHVYHLAGAEHRPPEPTKPSILVTVVRDAHECELEGGLVKIGRL